MEAARPPTCLRVEPCGPWGRWGGQWDLFGGRELVSCVMAWIMAASRRLELVPRNRTRKSKNDHPHTA
eukprot:703285-Prymnesium_polylepis.1